MKWIKGYACMTIALTCSMSLVAQEMSPVEQKIRQLEEDYRVASESQDTAWFEKHLSDKWVLVSHRDKTALTKADAISAYKKAISSANGDRNAPDQHSKAQVSKNDMKVYIVGHTGVVSYEQAVVGGQGVGIKKEFITDVFSETAGGWILIYTQEDSSDPAVA